jgi:hypothetical protein
MQGLASHLPPLTLWQLGVSALHQVSCAPSHPQSAFAQRLRPTSSDCIAGTRSGRSATTLVIKVLWPRASCSLGASSSGPCSPC